jgi:hypothetical protein
MARHSTNGSKNVNVGVFALEFIGSLFFLFLVYLMAVGKMTLNSVVFGGVGAFWLPLFAGASILASIALFFASFTYLSEPKLIAGEHTKNLGLKLAAVAGLTFFALTIGTPYFIVALAGFLLALIGGMVGYRL